MTKKIEKKVIVALVLALFVVGFLSVNQYNKAQDIAPILYNPNPYMDMPYHNALTELAAESDTVIEGRILNVEERQIDVNYDLDAETFYDYYVYTIEVYDSYKSSYEGGTIMEAKLMKGNGEYFQIGDEGLFFLTTFDDCPKDVPPELANQYNAYVGLDFENEEVIFNPFANESESQNATFSINNEPQTFEEIMSLMESL